MLKTFNSDDELAKDLSLLILKKIKSKKKFVLGCPGGRSLKKTYYYLGVFSSKLKISLENLVIIMMDEYVIVKKGKFHLVNPKSHFSCVRFSKQVIKKLLNYKKKNKSKLKEKNILFPDITVPNNYDHQIKKLGGIDIFLLASGTSDGHVAFNNIYSELNQRTHITKLPKKTREDNMKTFPQFKKLSEVPKYGLTVGLKTIYSLSKQGILVLTGKQKRQAYQKIISLNKFDIKWPASIIFKCKKNRIYIDKKAQTK
ncbi:6-phosphogluconolactonase [Alphaproteobacteria bacterium]|nr:6-phosphogluconolactonase [Alphaproteobacteria bacterium]